MDKDQSYELFYSLLQEGRMSLADGCRAIRSLRGMSQEDFARFAGVNAKVVKQLERGAGNARRESLEKIAGAAGLRVAFVSDRPRIGLLDARKRLAEEDAQRKADARSLRHGLSSRSLYEKNAMPLGEVKLALPRIG